MKAVIVTGSNGGIGSAISRYLQSSGWHVIGVDLGDDSNHLNTFIKCDLERLVSDADYRASFLRQIEEMPDIELAALVNNAALLVKKPVKRMSVDEFCSTININVTAAFVLFKMLHPLLARTNGAVVNIGSIHAKLTKPEFTAYATSKAALRGLTQSLAVEFGKQIRVNLIEPAAVATPMLLAGFSGKMEELESHHPAGRIGAPEEIAELTAFLISDQCRFLNGATIEISGGIAARLHDPE